MASSRRSTAVRDGTIVPAAAGFNNTDWARVAKALPHSLLPTVTARLRSATTMRKDCVTVSTMLGALPLFPVIRLLFVTLLGITSLVATVRADESADGETRSAINAV